MSNTNKMDNSAIFEMFETINNKLDKRTDKATEPPQIDINAINTMTERLENAMQEIGKPARVEHQHRHTIDVGSSSIFISLIVMALLILVLSFVVGNLRRNISKYRDNDLKYRYVKMQGQTNEENLYRLERQFRYSDSIKIIRKQVEKYEELVKEQAERIERARQNSEEVERLQREVKEVRAK
jgi:methyl-accepting chemotaxis protein